MNILLSDDMLNELKTYGISITKERLYQLTKRLLNNRDYQKKGYRYYYEKKSLHKFIDYFHNQKYKRETKILEINKRNK